MFLVKCQVISFREVLVYHQQKILFEEVRKKTAAEEEEKKSAAPLEQTTVGTDAIADDLILL